MGPYCKFCGYRCFTPTTKKDLILTDLKATCKEGKNFDLKMTFPKLKFIKSLTQITSSVKMR